MRVEREGENHREMRSILTVSPSLLAGVPEKPFFFARKSACGKRKYYGKWVSEMAKGAGLKFSLSFERASACVDERNPVA